MERENSGVTLDVAIVGAGIAGLSAAISLKRAGHNVTVYERSSFLNEVGAAINMPPQATRIMKAWGIELPGATTTPSSANGDCASNSSEGQNGTILHRTRRVNFKTAETFSMETFEWIPDRFETPFVSYHRADLHNILRTKAEELGATILLGHPVGDIDCQDGQIYSHQSDPSPRFVRKHDLVVIADGIHTSFVPHIVGYDLPLNRTGRTCYRTLVPTSTILSSESARNIFQLQNGTIQGQDGLAGTMNPRTGIYLIAYPCRSGTLMNVAVFDRPREDRVERDDWNSPAAIEDALQPIDDFNESFKVLVRCADNMKAFSLSERDPLPKYINGRAVLIGDSAHPMLPTLAGGGSTSLEDAVTLGLLFSDVADSTLETISSRLELFNALRLPRDATQQILSTAMFKPQPAAALKSRIEPFYSGPLPGTMLGGWNKATCEFLCGYDVFHETQKAMAWAEQNGWRNVGTLPDGLVQHFGPPVE
jgi:salicylate hydroxylase